MRLEAAVKAGYYPIPEHLLGDILDGLNHGEVPRWESRGVILDPCAGTGEVIDKFSKAHKYFPIGIELEETRYTQMAKTVVGKFFNGDAFLFDSTEGTYARTLYLNPPYNQGFEERRWLQKFTPMLVDGGLLIFVVPIHALRVCAQELAKTYKILSCWKFPEPEFNDYKQVVLFAQKVTLTGPSPVEEYVNLGSDKGLTPWAATEVVVPTTEISYYYKLDGRILSFDPNLVEAKPFSRMLGDASQYSSGVKRSTAVQLSPVHASLALLSGYFNGVVVSPNPDKSSWPNIMIKGVRNKTRRTIGEVGEESLEVTEVPDLKVTGIRLDTYEIFTPAKALEASGDVDFNDANLLDILLGYSSSLFKCLEETFEPLQRVDDTWPLPQLDRTLFPLQADRVRGAVKILNQGKSPIFQSQVGTGKGGRPTDRVLTPLGWVMYRDLAVGDSVVGSNGLPTKVTGVFHNSNQELFRVTFSDRTSVVVDGDHLWSVRHPVGKFQEKYKVLSTKVLSQESLRSLPKPKSPKGSRRFFIPMVQPVQYEEQVLPISPYVLGLLIGDGSFRSKTPTFSTLDSCLLDSIIEEFPGLTPSFDGRCTYCLGFGDRFHKQGNPIQTKLLELGLFGKRSEEKWIPEVYMRGSVDQRLALIQGLVDTDGYIRNTVVEYCTSSKLLAEQVRELVESLGGTAVLTSKVTPRLLAYRVIISLPENMLPAKLPRKLRYYTPKRPYRSIESVVPCGVGDTICLAVAAQDSLYVTEHHIVTHNTTMSLGLARILHPKNFESTCTALQATGVEVKHLKPVTRTLVMCPPHLPSTWIEEAKAVDKTIRVQEVRTISDLDADADLFILSREVAKLGCRTQGVKKCPKCGTKVLSPENSAKGRKTCDHTTFSTVYKDSTYLDHLKVLSEYDKRSALEVEESVTYIHSNNPGLPYWDNQRAISRLVKFFLAAGLLSVSSAIVKKLGYELEYVTLENVNLKDLLRYLRKANVQEVVESPPCGEFLYWYVPSPRRWPISKVLKRYKNRFDLVIVDEAHEMSNGETAQTQAMHRLVNLPCPTVLLTGSIFGGYASSLYHNLWASVPTFRDKYGRDGMDRYISRYGFEKFVVVPYEGVDQEFGAMTDRQLKSKKRIGEAPGVGFDLLIDYLLPQSLLLTIEDLKIPLKPQEEIPIDLKVENSDDGVLLKNFNTAMDVVLHQMRADKTDPDRVGKLFGAFGQLPSYLELAAEECGPFEVRYPDSLNNELLVTIPSMPTEYKSPKERWLLRTINSETAENRKVVVYITNTNSKLPERLQRLIKEECGEDAIFLDAKKVTAKKRNEWIKGQSANVMLVNSNAVRTGLNSMIKYCTGIWYQTNYSAFAYRQTNGRLRRPGQKKDVKVYWPVFGEVAALARTLVAEKVSASEQVDGVDVVGALAAAGISEATTSTNSVAKELFRRLSDGL